MVPNFNVTDYLVVIFAILYAFYAGRRGFLAELTELIGFLTSLLAALFLGPYFGVFLLGLKIPSTWANLVAFVFLWVGFEFLSLLLFNDLLKKVPMKLFLSRANRFLGYFPNLVNSLLIALFIASLVLVLPVSSSIKYELTQSSILGLLLPIGTSLNKPLNENFSQAIRDNLILLNKDLEEKSVKVSFPNLEESLITYDEASENKMLVLLNKERVERGLQILELDLTLREVARAHSKDMFVREYFGHFDPEEIDPKERLYEKAVVFDSAGENLSHAPDIETAHEGLMESPYHFDNILSDKFSKVGVGIAEAPGYGLMITQVFTN